MTGTHFAVAVLAVLLWNGRHRKKASTQLQDTIAATAGGTDWQGTLWERLNGVDLIAPDHQNSTGTASADVSRLFLLTPAAPMANTEISLQVGGLA